MLSKWKPIHLASARFTLLHPGGIHIAMLDSPDSPSSGHFVVYL